MALIKCKECGNEVSSRPESRRTPPFKELPLGKKGARLAFIASKRTIASRVREY
jgi:hypothetical protein